MEQTLGHRTHYSNLESILEDEQRLRPVWVPITWEASGLAGSLPVYRSNWTLRAGLRARSALGRVQRESPLDALFVHTQVPAVMLGKWLRRIPTIVSLDATPRQYDQLGQFYQHSIGSPRAERFKWKANRRCFDRAFALVTWSEWARRGLIDEYGIPAEKVSVISPGVRRGRWQRPSGLTRSSDEVRILFVGGDLDRKGGTLLLQAFRSLRDELEAGRGCPGPRLTLDLVTQTPVDPVPGVVVHHDLTANSAELISMYHAADIFCLPTHGDCLPMVLAEAGAAGLPLVATDVGAISEVVRNGETGILVPVDDLDALTGALRTLVEEPSTRLRMGANAADLIAREHDADSNARRLVDLLRRAAESGTGAAVEDAG
jgi:glycosyltransferase involved in cell wall biosynthesis